jgi:dihydrodipicolinate synthase/N-acetylneuraminate lyase
MSNRINGSLAEVFAAIGSDGSIDMVNTQRHIEYLVENGVNGLFVGGVAAEGLTFSLDERLQWLETTVNFSKSSVPVIFNICSLDIKDILKQLKLGEDIGADVISITQPSPISFPETDVLKYYQIIASAATVPLMLYNESAIGNPLKAETVRKIFQSFDNFKYYKDSTHNLIDTHSLLSIQNPPAILAGSDGLIYDIIVSGGSGVVSLVIDVFPKIITDIVRSLEKKDYVKALEQQRFILKIRSILKTGGLTAGYRFASGLVGIPLGNARVPYSTVSENDKNTIRVGLEDLKII